MNNRGFTLVELIAVVVIIGLVGGLAVPGILNSLDMGKKTSDRVLYSNIRTAMINMYEEVNYAGDNVYFYDNDGKGGVISSGDVIDINVQTLVSNGFLDGVNNSDYTVNKNHKVLFDSNNNDIGSCVVKIEKKKNGNKFEYIVSGSNENGCPTDEDLGV